jgi:phthalate 4,5-dioxygenase oxygenase subunit
MYLAAFSVLVWGEAAMTTAAENELLTRVGPGTPMGRFMREHWVPACMSSEIEADGAPLRLMLLGEQLIAFRDSTGRVGVMDHRCPHRCASLFFGRNEQGGLRCVYHGWKFDVDGNCVDMPNVPAEQDFKHRVKARTYPAAERSGLLYVYMGSRKTAPPLPEIEPTLLPADETQIYCRQRECNWLQAMEGDLDTSHFGFLHAGSVDANDIDPGNIDRFQVLDRAPNYHARETDWGAMYAAYRTCAPGELYYRFAHFVLPFWTLFPIGPFSKNIIGQAWVPMDDTHTMIISLSWKKRTPPLAMMKSGQPIAGLGRNIPPLPNTSDWFGRWRMPGNAGNDYLMDREVQRTQSYTGIDGVAHQDMAVTESMGAISDRTLEHLAPSDRMITLTRRRLINTVRAFVDEGVLPAVIDNPGLSLGARGGDLVAPESRDWLDVYDENLAGAPRPGLRQAAE